MFVERTIPVTAIILTYNEEANIEHALKSICGWVNEVFILDSYSTDRTLEIARKYIDKIYQHEFTHYAEQRNWALQNLPIAQEWVLFLDADEEATIEFRDELRFKLAQAELDEQIVAFSVRHRFFFLGKPLKYANLSIPHIRVVRKNKAFWHPSEGAMEQCVVKAQARELKSRLLHNNRKGLSDWIRKHNWYSTEEARYCLMDPSSDEISFANKIENKFPLLLRPFIKFLYVYFLRLGFLDGKAGLAYAFLHDFWFPFLVYLKVQEMKK